MRRAVSVWSMMPICIAAAHCALRRLGELLSAGLPTLLLVLGFHRVQQLPHDAAVLAASHTAIVSLQTYVMIQPMASAGDCVCSESSSTTANTKGPRHGPEHESAVATPGYPASLVTGVAGKELASAYTSCAKPQLDLHVIASNCLRPTWPWTQRRFQELFQCLHWRGLAATDGQTK